MRRQMNSDIVTRIIHMRLIFSKIGCPQVWVASVVPKNLEMFVQMEEEGESEKAVWRQVIYSWRNGCELFDVLYSSK